MSGHIEKLPNAPLQEVIFELHWKLDIDKESGLSLDPQFLRASDRFEQFVLSSFPHYKSLKPQVIPDHLFSFKPVHQYWKGDNIYPVMQLGPGMFSVNDTDKNYVWKDFKSTIFKGLEWLRSSYPEGLNLNFLEFRYIDAIELSEEESANINKFMESNLNVIIKNNVELPDYLSSGLQLTQRFKLENNNHLNLIFTDGIRNIDSAKVIVWHTFINQSGAIKFDDIETWIDRAHTVCSDLFKKIVSKKLYERFSKTN